SYASPTRVGIYWSVSLASRGSTPSGSIQYIDITTTVLPDATAGTAFNTTLAAGFGTGSTVNQWSVSPSLPAGLSLDSSTGVLSGTASAASTGTYTFTASQVSGGTVFARSSVDLALTVASEPAPAPTPTVEPPADNPSSVESIETVVSAPLVSAVTPGNFTWQRDLESAIRVVDNRGGGAVFTVEPELPTGLSLDPHAGIIRGIPTVVHRQSAFVVTATNSSGTNSATILVSVAAEGPSEAVLAAVESIRFPAGSSRLTKAAKVKLAIWLKTYPDQVLSLTGVVPQSGKGKSLARKRAVHIRAYLRARGAEVATTIQLTTATSPTFTRRVLMQHPGEASEPQ
ncbi:MAG: putative Ig domain-containing protein, partial [Candidatus Nanopelagicales bacterium]|nr:putative Ig domain-containing protein [Candidatus Nanopelagicales bacterium]